MDATALSPEDARELAAQRLRAYGPHPDIDDDPVALARLESLEAALHSAAPAPAHEPVPPSVPEFERSPVVRRSGPALAMQAPRPLREPVAAPDDMDAPAPRPRRRIRRRWVAVGAAAALIGAIVWGVTQLSAPRSDVTLGRIAAGEEGQRFARQGFLNAADVVVAEVQRFEAYEALQLWLIVAESGDRCLVVEAERYGILGVNCTPPALDPTIDIRIWRGMRTNIFGDLPPGTFLRFVHADDSIHVWVRPPAQETDPD